MAEGWSPFVALCSSTFNNLRLKRADVPTVPCLGEVMSLVPGLTCPTAALTLDLHTDRLGWFPHVRGSYKFLIS